MSGGQLFPAKRDRAHRNVLKESGVIVRSRSITSPYALRDKPRINALRTRILVIESFCLMEFTTSIPEVT